MSSTNSPGTTTAPASSTPTVSQVSSHVLETRGLTKRFGFFRAVDDVSLHVAPGEIYGFLGRNGAGKTTTIRMLMGITKPTKGTITLLGETAKRAGLETKKKIGYVSQEQHFYPWMSCCGIGKFTSGFFSDWDADEFSRLLELFGLPPKRRISRLSGGMRVKLGLALALSHRPALLILDEPTSSLDPVSRREFLEIVRTQATQDGRTVFFSTHRIEEVERIADCIGVLHEGKLRYEGAPAGLGERVRRIEVPEGWTPPADIEVLGKDAPGSLILQATPDAWAAANLPVASVSLEDAFVALAGGLTPAEK